MGMIVSAGALLRGPRPSSHLLHVVCVDKRRLSQAKLDTALGDEPLAHVRAGNALAARTTVLAIL